MPSSPIVSYSRLLQCLHFLLNLTLHQSVEEEKRHSVFLVRVIDAHGTSRKEVLSGNSCGKRKVHCLTNFNSKLSVVRSRSRTGKAWLRFAFIQHLVLRD